ncbi:MAG: sulfur carrier protein ThiS [Myxococcales bacterium]|nr:sulfur carrier protein ThiS [Myxococcales bacterium]
MPRDQSSLRWSPPSPCHTPPSWTVPPPKIRISARTGSSQNRREVGAGEVKRSHQARAVARQHDSKIVTTSVHFETVASHEPEPTSRRFWRLPINSKPRIPNQSPIPLNFHPNDYTPKRPSRYDGFVNPDPHISVNGDPREVPEGCTLDQLLGMLDLRDRRVAVAINRGIVPRARYAASVIADGDRIEILEAVGGG